MVFTFSCHNSGVNGSWIIDSRASDHICSSLHWFQHYSEIKPINVRLPNGHISIAKYSGTVIFSPGFKINNVLFVSGFSFNLICV